MLSKFKDHKKNVLRLRNAGKSYAEIRQLLKINISKSTLSHWCKGIILRHRERSRIQTLMKNNLSKAREKAFEVKRTERQRYFDNLRRKNAYLKKLLDNKDIAKMTTAMLYLGEGSKTRKGALMFGNSNPDIVALFLRLLRNCYPIDESKFRCTVQCRADQEPHTLENYWSKITKIPKNQFYKTKIDPRTFGKPSRKPDYKGVCRIDYFSADIYNELIILCDILSKGPIV